jgi:hypothetical protein
MPGRNGADDLARSLVKTAAKYDFKIGMNFIENCHFDWYPGGVDKTCDTREKLAEALKKTHQYLLDTYYSLDTALLVDGHPLLLLFCGTTPAELAACKAHPYRLPAGAKDYWYVRRAGIGPKMGHTRHAYRRYAHVLAGSYGWVVGRYRLSGKEMPKDLDAFDYYIDSDDMVAYQKQVAAMNDEYVRRGHYRIRMNSVCPGFDNRGCAGWGKSLWLMPREGGATHRKQWEVIVANRDRIDAVLAVTWNDYTEATCIEPTVEHGFQDVEMIARYGAAFKGVKADLAGIRLPARLFRLRKRAQFLARTGFDVRRLEAGLDQAARHISKGSYPRAESILLAGEKAVARMDEQVTSERLVAAVGGPVVSVASGPEPADGVYDTSARGLCLRFAEPAAGKLRTHNFDGFLEFEYLDEGTDYFVVTTSPARPDRKGPWHVYGRFSRVCRIRKDHTGKWVKARVKLYKVNCGFRHDAAHGSDFVFAGKAKVRNVSFCFDVFHRRLGGDRAGR